MRNPDEWQYRFGPAGAPVTIAGYSEAVRQLVQAIRRLGQSGGPKCVLCEGADGSGKSLAVAAFQAACQAAERNVALINEGTDPANVLPRVSSADAVIVDNLDALSEGLQKTLFERRHAAPCGTLITTSRMRALQLELLGPGDAYRPMGRWEDRPEDVLLVASLTWESLGQRPDLHEICEEGAPEVLSLGPWSRGAHSIRRAIAMLLENLELEGFSERPRLIGRADVLSALIGVIREERPTEKKDAIRIVVEGSTDARYVERAAELARDEWGADLLSGCEVRPAGTDRGGGAEKAVRELLLLELQGVTAIGLFDGDEPGRIAARKARDLTNQKILLLPRQFDRLKAAPGTEAVEIEDLIPLPLLKRFYEEHPGLEPEEETVRKGLRRIVVGGADKELAAEWLCANASFADMTKVVCVVCLVRESVGLPLPDGCPSVSDWIKHLCR